jgi:hypothetical protein
LWAASGRGTVIVAGRSTRSLALKSAMESILQFLNANAGALNLLFGGVVAIATVVYAVLTASLARETKKLREVQTEPHVELSFRSRDEFMSLIDIVVKNIGAGPAYDVTFEFSADTGTEGTKSLLASLANLNALSKGIAYLAPRQEISSYWTNLTEQFEDKLAAQVFATSRCKSVGGIEHVRRHTLDLSELKGLTRIGEPPLLKMSRSLEKLQDDVSRLASGWSKLKVHTYTSEDREAEGKQWEEEREKFRKLQEKPKEEER